MKTARLKPPSFPAKTGELANLRLRLAEAEETLRAIRNGEVDALVRTGAQGPEVFTPEDAGHPYRELIESMNEGALTLTADKMILYANHSFARMVRCPLEQVTGSSFRRFLSVEDRSSLRPLMKQAAATGSQLLVHLIANDGSRLPVQISIKEIAKVGFERVTISMIVTDMTEFRRDETQLRALTQRMVQVQEAERERVALELHNNVTQNLCAALFLGQAMAAGLSTHDDPVKKQAVALREMLSQTANEVERISRDLRSSVLDLLGLDAVLRATCTEFTNRTGVPLTMVCLPLIGRPTPDIKLALYRILQDALRNVEQHARARHVTVHLTTPDAFVQLTIKDDGTGFDPDHPRTTEKEKIGLGLPGMRERATYVGGVLTVKSARRQGTAVEARIPLPPAL